MNDRTRAISQTKIREQMSRKVEEGDMKYYYIAGEVVQGDYDESFSDVIEAHNKKEAKTKLLDMHKAEWKGFVIRIDTFYETSEDARP